MVEEFLNTPSARHVGTQVNITRLNWEVWSEDVFVLEPKGRTAGQLASPLANVCHCVVSRDLPQVKMKTFCQVENDMDACELKLQTILMGIPIWGINTFIHMS